MAKHSTAGPTLKIRAVREFYIDDDMLIKEIRDLVNMTIVPYLDDLEKIPPLLKSNKRLFNESEKWTIAKWSAINSMTGGESVYTEKMQKAALIGFAEVWGIIKARALPAREESNLLRPKIGSFNPWGAILENYEVQFLNLARLIEIFSAEDQPIQAGWAQNEIVETFKTMEVSDGN